MSADSARTRPEWAVFCIYGPQHVAALRQVLLPTLADPRNGDLPVFLLNYRDNNTLLEPNSTAGETIDLSPLRPPGRIGFGAAANHMYWAVRPRRGFLLVNPDSFPMPGCIERMLDIFTRLERPGIVEARQWPLEHPKEFDPASGATPWCSGAFCLIDSAAFETIGGFDPVYFLYNEDVDLSWRMRLAGYSLHYAQQAVAAHFTGLYSYRADRYYAEHFYSSRNFMAICYKFFGAAGERQAIALLHATPYPRAFKFAVLNAYRALKPTIARFPFVPDRNQFKITGFNLFHELRPT